MFFLSELCSQLSPPFLYRMKSHCIDCVHGMLLSFHFGPITALSTLMLNMTIMPETTSLCLGEICWNLIVCVSFHLDIFQEFQVWWANTFLTFFPYIFILNTFHERLTISNIFLICPNIKNYFITLFLNNIFKYLSNKHKTM